jgi:outer membrane lipoprotein-sorting protein
MSFLAQHPRVRWAAPVAAAALVVGGVATAQSSAGGQSSLPERSAHDLLVDLQHARPTALSGTVVQTMDLGLPQLSAGALGGGGPGSAGSLNPMTLLSGSHSWRVWYADPTHARLALVDGTGEYDVVRNGSDLWQWSSVDSSVVHATVRPRSEGGRAGSPTVPPTSVPHLPDLSSPDAVATWALSQLDPTTVVRSTETDRVAGRPAHGLVLTPRTPGSRIGSVHLSLDAETSLPLAATVLPRGSTRPAVDVRYSSLSTATPDPAVFRFTPPPGARVTTADGDDRAATQADPAAGARPHVIGTGWSSVVVGKLPAMPAGPGQGHGPDPLTAIRKVLPEVSGPWGTGRLFRTRLFTAVLTDDGRFAAGAVDPSALYAALVH